MAQLIQKGAASVPAIQDFLTRSGYLEASVDPETTFIRGQGRASVLFHVTRGPRAHVAHVNLAGNIAQLEQKMTAFPAIEEILQRRIEATQTVASAPSMAIRTPPRSASSVWPAGA